MVLPAGSYWLVLAEEVSNRNVVRIFSGDGSKLYATLQTIPVYRDRRSAGSEFTFAERPRGGHEALVKWYYPNREKGCEFAYPPEVEQRLARDVHRDVDASPQS